MCEGANGIAAGEKRGCVLCLSSVSTAVWQTAVATHVQLGLGPQQLQQLQGQSISKSRAPGEQCGSTFSWLAAYRVLNSMPL
jgi:hypothetical protein